MASQVDFYYDYGSPTAYLAWTQLPELCARRQAKLNYRPVLLGGIFKATGNASPVVIKAKGEWLLEDVARYAAFYDIPFTMNPHFIINSLTMMRGAMWALNEGVIDEFNQAMFQATWVNGLNTADAEVIASVMESANLDHAAMLKTIKEDAIKKQLIDATQSAVDQGVFGAPTMIVGGELHFGQDRLAWVERKLTAVSD